jgi:hypothetical protein
MPGIICEIRIASRPTDTQRDRNCESAYAHGVATARLSTTVPAAMIKLVTRLPPCSLSARR